MTQQNSWIDVDLDVIGHNTKVIKNYIENAKLLAVVKSDAYGHGILPVALKVIDSGADFLGVSNIDEGIFLRENGINIPILLLNPFLPEHAEEVIRYNLTSTVCSFDMVQALNKAALKFSKRALIHIKIDTGFGRFGLLPEHVLEFVKIISENLKNIYIEGIYTHFSSASNKSITYTQFAKFMKVVQLISDKGFNIPIKHVCNSAATVDYPEMHLDMVRTGNLLYGLCPSGKLNIKKAAKIYSKIIFIKNLPPNHNVGYGNKFKTKKATTIAIIPFGYYDGLALVVSQSDGIFQGLKSFIKQCLLSLGVNQFREKVKVDGKFCDVIGKISMQNCIIDITEIKSKAIVGDTVELSTRKVNLCYNIPRVYYSGDIILLDERKRTNIDQLYKSDLQRRGSSIVKNTDSIL